MAAAGSFQGMRTHGVARAVGFDPSMDGRETPYVGEGVTIVPEYFAADRAAREG